MSNIITNAGAAGPDAASVPTPEARIAAAVKVMGSLPAEGQAPAPAPAPEKPAAAPEPPKESLAEVIRAQREARQAAQQEATKRSSLEQELKAARDELARAKADRQAFEDDPVAFAKARGWTKEQQLLYGQSLLYDLAPDKADPEYRFKMFEDKQKRKEAEDAKAAKEAAAKAETEAQEAQLHTFYKDTASAVRDFESGSYPECEAWFGDDFSSYMKSIMATASNIAAQANKTGQVADLSPAALAAALEAEVADRLARRDERKQKRNPAPVPAAPPAPPPAARGDEQTALDTLSVRNLSGGGTPQSPATSEKERIQRAVAVAFRPR